MAEDWQARARAAEAEVQRLTALWNTCGSAYPGYEGQLCPFCVHREGQLVSMCGLHKRLADAEAEVIGRVKRLVEAEERALKLSEELQKYTTPAAIGTNGRRTCALESTPPPRHPAEVDGGLG